MRDHPSTAIDTARAARMMPIVERMARRLARRLPASLDVRDLVGAGHVGLATALKTCAGRDDSAFEAYAIWRIRGEMVDELRRMDRLSRRQRDCVRRVERAEHSLRAERGRSVPPAAVAERAGVPVETYHEARSLAAAGEQASFETLSVGDRVSAMGMPWGIDEALDAERRLSRVRGAYAQLPARLQRVLSLHHAGSTLRDIGSKLGVTEARVCQLHKQALEQVRGRAFLPSIPPAATMGVAS